ncbi:hypothetical protein FB451DRAFT_474171 [Mycena latifolia]|nr:hypothetical protein FB451DRAFT_474171 [Mycena latifolia]
MDGDTDIVSAQDFMRSFHRDMKVTTSKANKAAQFQYYLVAGSEVDVWYKGLDPAIQSDMDALDAAVEVRYPAQEIVQPTVAEYELELTKTVLKMEDLDTKVKVADKEVWAHHAWANKVMRLATKAEIATTKSYIAPARSALPKAIRSRLKKDFKNWAEFTKAVKDVDLEEMLEDVKEYKEEKAEKSKVTAMLARGAALQASPTAAIRQQLGNTTISRPQQQTQWSTPAANTNPFAPAAGGGQGNLFRPPRPAFTPQQPLAGAERAALQTAIAHMPHHPDTPDGRAAHQAQQHKWVQDHGIAAWVTISTPYPLRPGRAPINSGECHKCGVAGHTNWKQGCPTPEAQCLNPKERAWRKLVSLALKEAPAAVRMVGYEGYEVDDYGVRYDQGLEQSTDQGKGEGLFN